MTQDDTVIGKKIIKKTNENGASAYVKFIDDKQKQPQIRTIPSLEWNPNQKVLGLQAENMGIRKALEVESKYLYPDYEVENFPLRLANSSRFSMQPETFDWFKKSKKVGVGMFSGRLSADLAITRIYFLMHNGRGSNPNLLKPTIGVFSILYDVHNDKFWGVMVEDLVAGAFDGRCTLGEFRCGQNGASSTFREPTLEQFMVKQQGKRKPVERKAYFSLVDPKLKAYDFSKTVTRADLQNLSVGEAVKIIANEYNLTRQILPTNKRKVSDLIKSFENNVGFEPINLDIFKEAPTRIIDPSLFAEEFMPYTISNAYAESTNDDRGLA